jgi:hypothetical protein
VHFVYSTLQYQPELSGTIETVEGARYYPSIVTPSPVPPRDAEGGQYLAPSLLPLWEQLGHEQEAETHGASVDKGPLPDAFFLSPQ